MTKTSFIRKRGEPFRFTQAERARLDAMTDAEIEATAKSDPDNPPMDEARLNRMVLARAVRLIREQTGLSQSQFATRYRIGLARLRDYEQGRSEPDLVVKAFYRLILEDPRRAEGLVARVEHDGLSPAH